MLPTPDRPAPTLDVLAALGTADTFDTFDTVGSGRPLPASGTPVRAPLALPVGASERSAPTSEADFSEGFFTQHHVLDQLKLRLGLDNFLVKQSLAIVQFAPFALEHFHPLGLLLKSLRLLGLGLHEALDMVQALRRNPCMFVMVSGQSIDLLLMVVIGGLGSVHGAFLGAIFLISMPQLIVQTKNHLPDFIGQAPGLQGLVYGLVLIGFVLFEPMGIYGRWLKVRTYLQVFPFYRKGMFKRQKSFQKSDRLR